MISYIKPQVFLNNKLMYSYMYHVFLMHSLGIPAIGNCESMGGINEYAYCTSLLNWLAKYN